MCGIFGYIGQADAIKKVLDGLCYLEYRGYDSFGIASVNNNELFISKHVGKISEIKTTINHTDFTSKIAFGHTRWATHGQPTIDNAHPHFDQNKQCAIVHNGIIENYLELKSMLESKNIKFCSETDSEVVVQLIAFLYEGNLLEAVNKAVNMFKGSFTISVIHVNHPDEIVCSVNDCSFAVGLLSDEIFFASDYRSFINHTNNIVILKSEQTAVITQSGLKVYGFNGSESSYEIESIDTEAFDNSKGVFEHYMLKEIYEQPSAIKKTLKDRLNEVAGYVEFTDLDVDFFEFDKKDKIIITACGSSLHAAIFASYLLEDLAGIEVSVEIASEFRYRNPVINNNAILIAISQSGETADTLAAMRMVKNKGVKVLGICNVKESALAREADGCIFLKVGPEIGVASTKAFTSQIVVFNLLVLLIARKRRSIDLEKAKSLALALRSLPEQINLMLNASNNISSLVEKYSSYDNFIFIGRRLMYPIALELALKLKEVAYVNASAYPAGEIKHGPIALIDENIPVVALCTDFKIRQKFISNLMEIKARNGKIIAVVKQDDYEVMSLCDDYIEIPACLDEMSPVLVSVFGQLFAYYFGLARNRNIDMPRNLAKSVTVE